MPGTLYVVATPIGNLEDVTLRAARVLGEVSLIAAEDTRRTRKLLTHLGLHTRMLSYNEHNAAQRTPRILRAVLEDDVALVSDAGVPIVSDPGAGLVRAAAEQGTVVVPIPGPSAVTAALAAAGMPANAFHFLGFPPRARGARTALITPHRLRATLEDLRVVLGDRPIVVCRELTKLHEELFHGTPSEALDHFDAPRGEIVIVVAGAEAGRGREADATAAGEAIARLKAAGATRRDTTEQVVDAYGISRRDAYRMWLQA